MTGRRLGLRLAIGALACGTMPWGAGCDRGVSRTDAPRPVPSEAKAGAAPAVTASVADAAQDSSPRDLDGFTIHHADLYDFDSGVDPECHSGSVGARPADADALIADVVSLPWWSHSMGAVSAELLLTRWAKAEPSAQRIVLPAPDRGSLWTEYRELLRGPKVMGSVNARAVVRFRTATDERWLAFDQECRLVQTETHACFAMTKELLGRLVAALPSSARAEILSKGIGECGRMLR